MHGADVGGVHLHANCRHVDQLDFGDGHGNLTLAYGGVNANPRDDRTALGPFTYQETMRDG